MSMTTPDNALPVALKLADRLEDFALALPAYGFDDRPPKDAAAELRRLHAESTEQADRIASLEAEKQQLKSLNARLQPTIEDDSQEWAKCDPAIAFHLIERHAGNWADAGKMMTEFAEAKAEVKLKALRDELVQQTNRAASAEQQATALTQRLNTANALNTEARNELASLKLSQAQAVQIEGLHNACTYALEWLNECGGNLAHNVVDVLEQALAASPTPPTRKGLSDERIADIAEQVEALDPNDSIWVELTRLIEAAHGIQGEGNE